MGALGVRVTDPGACGHTMLLLLLIMVWSATPVLPTCLLLWMLAAAGSQCYPLSRASLHRARWFAADIDAAEISKNKIAHYPVCADVKQALHHLNGLLDKEPMDLAKIAPWVAELNSKRQEFPMRYPQREDAIVPQYAIQVRMRAPHPAAQRQHAQDANLARAAGWVAYSCIMHKRWWRCGRHHACMHAVAQWRGAR